MAYTANRTALAAAIGHVARAVGSTSSIPTMRGIHCSIASGVMTLNATNGDLGIADAVDVDGAGDVTFVLPARSFADVVAALPGDTVAIDVHDDDADLSCGDTSFTVRTLPADDFPRQIRPDGDGHTVGARDLLGALRQVVPAASGDETRPVLTAVSVRDIGDGLELAATDSYRLAVRTVPVSAGFASDKQVLVPASTFAEMLRLFRDDNELTVWFGQRSVAFAAGRRFLTSRLVEGEYPNYRPVIPATSNSTVSVQRTELAEVISRARVLARDVPVLLATDTEGMLVVRSTAPDVGSATDKVKCHLDGPDVEFAAAPAYLLAALDALTSDEIVVHVVDRLRPIRLAGLGDENLTYVVMPVRLP